MMAVELERSDQMGFYVRVLCNKRNAGTSLVVQWVRLRAPNAGGPGSIPGWGTRCHMHAATKKPSCCN